MRRVSDILAFLTVIPCACEIISVVYY